MFKKIRYSKLVGNSFWGVLNSTTQSIIASLFFILVARQYEKNDFSMYILANSLYGILISFSNLGLQQWYIREIKLSSAAEITPLFSSIQLMSGVLFFVINIIAAYFIYHDSQLILLSTVLGLNIIFDSLIYVAKSFNIAVFQQRTTFMISIGESSAKLLLGVVNIWAALDIFYLILLLVLLRMIVMVAHIFTGPLKSIEWIKLSKDVFIKANSIAVAIYRNRYFMIIGSVSVIYWSIGNFFISKYLGMHHVPTYEIAYKLFSIAEIIPVILSTSVFPILLEKVKLSPSSLLDYFSKTYWIYMIYGLFAYSTARAFVPWLIPFVFGEEHFGAIAASNQMFLTMLLFPTVLLQANMIIAIGKEQIDMWFNICSLLIYISISMWGLNHYGTSEWVSYGILISFFIFHLMQDIYLFVKGYLTQVHILQVYSFLIFAFLAFEALASLVTPFFAFSIFWILFLLISLPFLNKAFA